MPIRPENKARYPKDWPSISLAARERAGNRCEACGVRNHELGGRDELGEWHRAASVNCRGDLPRPGDYAWCRGRGGNLYLRIVKIVLTVAHLDHQPENCDPENLRAWCQRCHNRYDMAMRRAGIRERARLACAVGDLFDAPAMEAAHAC